MANQNPGPQAQEKQHTLPDTFIDKREELYVHRANISKAIITRDHRLLKEAVIEYMTVLDYVCNRIRPKLQRSNQAQVDAIEDYLLQALQTVKSSDTIPMQTISDIKQCHGVITDIMANHGFDQITPTILNI